MSDRVVGLTGATGYIGSELSRVLRRVEGDVVTLGRRDQSEGGRAWDLDAPRVEGLLEGISVVIHAAWDVKASSWDAIARRNIQGSLLLLEEAKRVGALMIFVSSMAAFPGCRSLYGRSKLQVEEAVLAAGGIVIRPGTVYGEASGGIVGKILLVMRRLRVAPLIGGGAQDLHVIERSSLVRAIQEIVDAPDGYRGSVLVAVDGPPTTLREFFKKLAAAHGIKALLIPLPAFLVWAPLKLLELLGLSPPLRSDSVISISHVVPRSVIEGLPRIP